MTLFNIEEIQQKICELHSNDTEHLTAIFSDADKLIIEAPAGSGKTQILISKIAYNLAINKVPRFKKILALTFGVNAAYKIKKDIAVKLPELTNGTNDSPNFINNTVTVTNFHGFARRVLKKYGYLINSKLKELNELECVSDAKMEDLGKLDIGLSEPQMQWITNLNLAIVQNKKSFYGNPEDFTRYIYLVEEYFLPKNKIPFNAILIFLLHLFKQYPHLRSFYNKLYPIIVVDEFQDTNVLSWEIIISMLQEKTKLWLLGDSLQRIYGFIGAIENLIDIAKADLKMEKIELHTNYRFKNNKDLLLLDSNIRECAKNIANPTPKEGALLNTYSFDSLEEENQWTIDYIKEFIEINDSERLAILIKQRSFDVDQLVDSLIEQDVDFFYALFNEDDIEYINFHKFALKIFISEIQEKKPKAVTKQFIKEYYHKVRKNYVKGSMTEQSLLRLLEALIENIFSEYKLLDKDEKIDYIIDILTNRSLKQCLEYIKSRVILSTVHGAKGLEWEHVILRGMKDFSFPSFSLCLKCNKYKVDHQCVLNTALLVKDDAVRKAYLEELSVFYVGVTRAKKTLCVTTNAKRINKQNTIFDSTMSCFLQLPGIVPILK